MDIATSVGLIAGIAVLCTLVLMGGDFKMFYDIHAVIIIFGGSIAATLIRFPLSAIMHGMPLGAKFAFTLSRLSARDLVDELARIAEIARKQGPVGLERSRPTSRSSPRASASSPTATISNSSATTSSATATTF